MIEYVTGNILDSTADAIVIPVNCVGTMGAGLAKQFKARYPEAYGRYCLHCCNGNLRLGNPTGAFIGSPGPQTQQAVFLPTKHHWREKSELEPIRAGLHRLAVQCYEQHTLRREVFTVAMPRLGCGLGGLAWHDVRPLIVEAFGEMEGVMVRVYGSRGTR